MSNHIKLDELQIEWKRGGGLRKSDVTHDGKNKCVLYGELFTKHKRVMIDPAELSLTNRETGVLSKNGDILVPGTSTASRREMVLAREINIDGVLIGGDINIIRPKAGTFAPKYLPYYFNTPEAFQQLDRYITGATGIIHLSNAGIRNLVVPMPPLEVQQEIVKRLDVAYEKIDYAIRLTEANRESAQSLFDILAAEILRSGSENWTKKKIGEVCELSQGLAINAKTKHLLVEKSNLPLLRIKDLRSGGAEQYVDEERFPVKALIGQEDLIYTRTGQIGLVFRNRIGVLHNNSFKITPDSLLSKDYLYWWLQDVKFRETITRLASRAAQPDITHKIFKEQFIFVPPLETQRILSVKLDDFYQKTNDLVNKYTHKKESLLELRNALLKKAFSERVVG